MGRGMTSIRMLSFLTRAILIAAYFDPCAHLLDAKYSRNPYNGPKSDFDKGELGTTGNALSLRPRG